MPPSQLTQKWGDTLTRLDGGQAMRVGIVWAGNPNHHNDHNRSIPFRLFKKLLDIYPLTWVSLQVGDRAYDLHQTTRIVFNAAPELHDYNETAGLIENLDLVITVDSSAAHLAGALGTPVWVLVPFAPDWRWQLAREDSPWYESVRLFRQQQIGNWSEVLQRVKTELKEFINSQ